jgi:hypothetical protein
MFESLNVRGLKGALDGSYIDFDFDFENLGHASRTGILFSPTSVAE